MSRLFILVGIPGCGKSTWANTFFSHAEIVSSDAIREELAGDATDQSKNGQVFNVFHQRIGEQLAQDNDVVADSTALDKFARDNLFSIAQTFGSEVHLIVFANIPQAAYRNLERERVVPENVMLRMLDKYEDFEYDLYRGENTRYTSITEIVSTN